MLSVKKIEKEERVFIPYDLSIIVERESDHHSLVLEMEILATAMPYLRQRHDFPTLNSIIDRVLNHKK